MAADTEKPDAPLDRIRKLINLASSTNRQEADRAAYMACALIREHGLDIVDPDQINEIYESTARLEAKVQQLEAVKPVHVNDPDADTFNFNRAKTRPAPAPFSTPYSNIPHKSQQRPSQQRPLDAPVAITSKFAGVCKQCGVRHGIGDQLVWMPGIPKGVWCGNACYQQWKKGQGPTSFSMGFDPTSSVQFTAPNNADLTFQQMAKDVSEALDQITLDALFGPGRLPKKDPKK